MYILPLLGYFATSTVRCTVERSAGYTLRESPTGFADSYQVPRVSRAPGRGRGGVMSLGIFHEDLLEIRPIMDSTSGNVLEPHPSRVG